MNSIYKGIAILIFKTKSAEVQLLEKYKFPSGFGFQVEAYSNDFSPAIILGIKLKLLTLLESLVLHLTGCHTFIMSVLELHLSHNTSRSASASYQESISMDDTLNKSVPGFWNADLGWSLRRELCGAHLLKPRFILLT